LRDDNLIGVMRSDLEAGFPTPPQETTFTVHNQQTN
jgi:hypothetical protein